MIRTGKLARAAARWLALGTAAAAVACAAIVGLPDVPDVEDGGVSDASAADAVEAASPCARYAPPPPPAADDPSDVSELAFVAAMRTLDFGTRLDAGTSSPYGYDLDHVFTCCQGAPESCASATGTTHCDADGGLDNSGGQLLASLAQVAAASAISGIGKPGGRPTQCRASKPFRHRRQWRHA